MLRNGNPDEGHRPVIPFPPTVVVAAPRGDPRRKIREAAIETVAHRGYDRATVGRIVACAGVADAVFSEHFEDKHDCFMQAIDELLGAVERQARRQFERPEPWAERVREGLRALLAALAANPDGARVVLVEMLSAGPGAHERHRRVLSLLTALMEEGRSRLADPWLLPAQTSEAVVGGVVSILHRRVLQGATEELPSLQADLTYFALLPYLDQEAALAVARARPT
jgi:AcrR family transcriptional regulator